MFKVGDTVIHPGYGICKIKTMQKDDVEGVAVCVVKPRKPLSGDFKILIPKEKIKISGVRHPINKNRVPHLLQLLEGEPNDLSEDCKRGYFQTKEKMQTGDPYKTAEVVRDLEKQDNKSFSSRGDDLLQSARKMLITEIAYVKRVSKDEIEKWMDGVLNKKRKWT